MKQKRSTFRRRHNPTLRHGSDLKYAFRGPDGKIVDFAEALGPDVTRMRPRSGINLKLLRGVQERGYTGVTIARPLNRGSGAGTQRALLRERKATLLTAWG